MMDKAEIVFEKLAAYDTSIGDYFDYGKNLVKHKVDMYRSGRQISIPRTKLLMHDMDKFFPKMFMRYAEWFYGPEGRTGTRNPKLKKEWKKMVREHYARSPHHYHKLKKDRDVMTELETLTDWYSAMKRSRGYNKPGAPTFRSWIDKNIDKLPLSGEAKRLVIT